MQQTLQPKMHGAPFDIEDADLLEQVAEARRESVSDFLRELARLGYPENRDIKALEDRRGNRGRKK